MNKPSQGSEFAQHAWIQKHLANAMDATHPPSLRTDLLREALRSAAECNDDEWLRYICQRIGYVAFEVSDTL